MNQFDRLGAVPTKPSISYKFLCGFPLLNLLNDVEHPSTTILPLTTQLIEDAAPLRYRIISRDGLEFDSDVMLDQTRTIDNRRISNEQLTALTGQEISEIELYWRIVLALA